MTHRPLDRRSLTAGLSAVCFCLLAIGAIAVFLLRPNTAIIRFVVANDFRGHIAVVDDDNGMVLPKADDRATVLIVGKKPHVAAVKGWNILRSKVTTIEAVRENADVLPVLFTSHDPPNIIAFRVVGLRQYGKQPQRDEFFVGTLEELQRTNESEEKKP